MSQPRSQGSPLGSKREDPGRERGPWGCHCQWFCCFLSTNLLNLCWSFLLTHQMILDCKGDDIKAGYGLLIKWIFNGEANRNPFLYWFYIRHKGRDLKKSGISFSQVGPISILVNRNQRWSIDYENAFCAVEIVILTILWVSHRYCSLHNIRWSVEWVRSARTRGTKKSSLFFFATSAWHDDTKDLWHCPFNIARANTSKRSLTSPSCKMVPNTLVCKVLNACAFVPFHSLKGPGLKNEANT